MTTDPDRPNAADMANKAERDAAWWRETATEAFAALKPFADCCEYIADDESDEEWAKFRLLVKDYRAAKAVVEKVGAHD